MKKPTIAAVVQPLAGQQLPPGWQRTATEAGGTFDRRNLSEMWKQGTTNKKIEVDSPTRNARLQPLSWNDLYGRK